MKEDANSAKKDAFVQSVTDSCVPSIDGNALKGKELLDRAEAFRILNPKAYDFIEQSALRLARNGRKFGLQMVVEVLRYDTYIKSKDGDFSISNSTVAGLARMLIKDHPEIADYLQIKKSCIDAYLEALNGQNVN